MSKGGRKDFKTLLFGEPQFWVRSAWLYLSRFQSWFPIVGPNGRGSKFFQGSDRLQEAEPKRKTISKFLLFPPPPQIIDLFVSTSAPSLHHLNLYLFGFVAQCFSQARTNRFGVFRLSASHFSRRCHFRSTKVFLSHSPWSHRKVSAPVSLQRRVSRSERWEHRGHWLQCLGLGRRVLSCRRGRRSRRFVGGGGVLPFFFGGDGLFLRFFSRFRPEKTSSFFLRSGV